MNYDPNLLSLRKLCAVRGTADHFSISLYALSLPDRIIYFLLLQALEVVLLAHRNTYLHHLAVHVDLVVKEGGAFLHT